MRTYPAIPADAKTGLLLFGCAMLGENDGKFFREAGLDTLCIDIEQERIDEMKPVIPEFRYLRADAYGFARGSARDHHMWDVVSVDPFSNDASAALIYRKHWAAIAGRMLVLGASTVSMKANPEEASALWWTERIERNRDWCWLIKRWGT